MPSPKISILVLAAALPLFGCSTATRNVRAFRAYAHESANINVCLDRIDDLAAILDLTDRMLTKTPYTPGDKWVARLPLDDEHADKIRDKIRESPPYQDVDFEVPTIKIYRVHLEAVLKKAAEDRPTGEAQFPSLLDAVSTLAAASKDIKAQWAAVVSTQEAVGKAYEDREEAIRQHPPQQNQPEAAEITEARRKLAEAEKTADQAKVEFETSVRAVSQVQATDPDKLAIMKDELVAASVALRLDLEALALIPIVVVQTARSVPNAPRDLLQQHDPKSVGQILALPDHVEAIEERLGQQIKVMQEMASSLATVMKTEIDKTPGFIMRESIVDQIVGITFDSFHINGHAGAEMFFFAEPGGDKATSSTTNSDNSTTTKDFSGRKYRLQYDVSPIVMLRANLNIGFDWIHLPNAADLNFGYSTDRVFSRGGNIEDSGSLGKELGLTGFASDVFDAGLGVVGVKTNVRVANFTTGQVTRLANPDSGTPVQVDTTALQLSYKQIDVGYDISFLFPEFAGRYYIEEFTLGFRYMDYTLPRIPYQLIDSSGQGNNYRFELEGPAQSQRSQYYMGGLLWRLGPGGTTPGFSVFFDLGIYGGSGPADYLLYQDTMNTNRMDEYSASVFVVDAAIGGGLRFRLTPRASRFRLLAEAQYHAELVHQQIIGASDSNDNAKRIVEFGAGTDLFHGPRLSVVGSF